MYTCITSPTMYLPNNFLNRVIHNHRYSLKIRYIQEIKVQLRAVIEKPHRKRYQLATTITWTIK